MLKIKDNIDLKELEKFGFKKEKNEYKTITFKTNSWALENGKRIYAKTTEEIVVLENKIIIYKSKFNKNNDVLENWIYDLEILYDLIKADLVEKVEE